MKTRKLAITGILAALSTVLMFVSFSVPIMPWFIELDISELPALLASFSLGPLYAFAVCVVKILLNIPFSRSLGVGELSNLLISIMFVVPAGIIYKCNKNRTSAFFGALTGAILAAVLSIFTNYYIIYPAFSQATPIEAIIEAYQVINPNVENLWDAILWFNFPFTFVKCMLSVVVTFMIYKKISPLLKGE